MSERPVSVNGITELDFNTWKYHPVTRIVNQLYQDKRVFIERAAIEEWVNGGKELRTDLGALRGQIIELTEMHDMSFEALVHFYGQDNSEKHASEDNQDDAS